MSTDNQNEERKGLPNKWNDKATNYCLEEAKASYKCLDKNNYNKSACEEYFEAYRQCKKRFNAIKSERRRRGLHPIPSPKEMEELK